MMRWFIAHLLLLLLIILVAGYGFILNMDKDPGFDTSNEALKKNLNESKWQKSVNVSDNEHLKMKQGIEYKVGDYVIGLDDVQFVGYSSQQNGWASAAFSVNGNEFYYRIEENKEGAVNEILLGGKRVMVTDTDTNAIRLSVLEK